MSPKVKPESFKVRKSITEDSWLPILNSIIINDDHWSCMVTMMIETLPEHAQYVSIFNEAAEVGERKAVFSLSYEKLIHFVKVLSREDPDKCSRIQGICHYANRLLEESEFLPASLMANLVKYMLYKCKETLISRMQKKLGLEQDIARELHLMQTAPDLGANLLSNKTNTQLTKRGEEWRDKIFVDDSPEKGPDLYFILTGFYDPNLPLELISVGVPLTGILKIKQSQEELNLDDMEDSESVNKRNRFNPLIAKTDLVKFWKEFETCIEDSKRSEDFCKLMFLTFCPPEIEVLEKEPNKMKDLYDRICFIIYDLYEIYRQHIEYLKTMKLQNVYEERPLKQNISSYKNIMADIPEESATVLIVLNALITQVEENCKPSSLSKHYVFENRSSDLKMSRISTDSRCKLLYNQIRSDHTSMFLGELQTDASLIPIFFLEMLVAYNIKNKLITIRDHDYDLFCQIGDPKLVLHGETHQLHNEQRILFEINTLYPKIAAIWNRNLLNRNLQQKYAYHLNILANSFEKDVDITTLRHYLNILALRNISRGQRFLDIEEKGGESKIRSVLLLPLNTETLFLQYRSGTVDLGKDMGHYFECPVLCTLADSREILQPGFLEKNCLEQDRFSEFEDVELLSASVFQKTLQKCFEEFINCQMQYFEPTDTVLIFFSQCNNFEVNERVESGILPTPICLREFCKNFINESHLSSGKECQEMDLKGEDRVKVPQRTQSEKDVMILQAENFILPTSLKAEVLRKVRQPPVDERKPKIREDRIVSEVDTKKGEILSKKEELSKGKKEKSIKEKVSKERILDTPIDTSFLPKREKLVARCAEEGEPFESTGYDLGERKIKVFSIKKTLCSIDGTVVDIDIETGLDSRKLLRIGINNFGCRLQLHSVIEANCLYSMFPLHFTTPEGLIIAFTKLRDNNRASNSSSEPHLWYPFFDFRVTWPSGLYIESVAGYTAENPFYIQQKYISKLSQLALIVNETHRKYLRNGTVVIFLEDGTVTVLQSNGTIVTCTEFKKLGETEDDIDFPKSEAVPRTILVKETDDVSSKKRNRESFDEISFESVVSTLETEIGKEIASHGEEPPNIKISKYSVLEPDGRHYEVREDVVVQFNRLLVKTASSYEVDERFARRADGTDMLLKSNGDFIVSFPDGTRIKTGYIIEDECLICDWSENELEEYFALKPKCEPFDHSNLDANLNENEELVERTKILESDSFVSVLLTSRMEHLNYSTVEYNPVFRSCILSMPGEVNIRISRDGILDVTVASKVELNVQENNLTLSAKTCSNCKSKTTTFYELQYPASGNGVDLSKESVLTTTDMFGNIFTVKYDGTSSYESKKKMCCGCERGDGGKSCLDEYSSSESEKKEVEEQGQKKKIKNFHSEIVSKGRCRIFAMNRDLTANEYLHRSEKLQHEKRIFDDDKSSLVNYQVPSQLHLGYKLTLSPLKPFPKFGSWFKNTLKVEMTNQNRKDILRSTYSNPYNWLFPFGKDGNGIRNNTFDKPLTELDVNPIPEVLEVRIIRTIKDENINPVIDTQRAIGRYCQKMINQFDKYHSYSPTDDRNTYERNLEDALRNISLGIQKTIEIETYRQGLLKSSFKKVEKMDSTVHLNRMLEKRYYENKNYEFYRHCMRKKIFISYFKNITGVCFLWVRECVEQAMSYSAVKYDS